ncbi:MAG: vitamin K epoxide reductase family protein [Verrucomicrobiales bacterium]
MNLQNFVKALGRLLIFGAFCLATWMGYSALQNSVAGCGPGSGCAELLDTRWATAFGIPVAFFGALVYFAAFAGRSGGPAFLRFGWVLSLWLIPIAAGWFLAIQIATGTFCKWCLITHALACAGAAMLLWLAQRDPKAESDGIVMRLGSPACALVAWFALATFQLFSVPPEPSIPIARQMVAEQVLAERHGDMVWLHGGKIKVRIKDCPSIGPKNSEQVAVALIDYACAGCRRMRGVLEDVKQKLGDEACVLYLPGVATPEGAALHRHMLVLSRIDPELHDAFARDLSAGRLIADPEALLRKIAGAVGAEAFQDAARQNVDWVDAMMASGAELQRLNEERRMCACSPSSSPGRRSITGLDESPDNYIAAARTRRCQNWR